MIDLLISQQNTYLSVRAFKKILRLIFLCVVSTTAASCRESIPGWHVDTFNANSLFLKRIGTVQAGAAGYVNAVFQMVIYIRIFKQLYQHMLLKKQLHLEKSIAERHIGTFNSNSPFLKRVGIVKPVCPQGIPIRVSERSCACGSGRRPRHAVFKDYLLCVSIFVVCLLAAVQYLKR